MAESNESMQTESNESTQNQTIPCVCSHVLPEIQGELTHMKREVLKLLNDHPSWGGLIYDTLKYGIKGHIIEDQLAKGRCFELQCLNEIPAISKHFICGSDIHII